MFKPYKVATLSNRVRGEEPSITRGENKETILDRFRALCKRNLLVCNYISIIIVILFAIHGWLYALFYIPCYAFFLLWLHWETYLMGLDMVETQLWGRPLNYYKENNIPRPKLKFVWRKER